MSMRAQIRLAGVFAIVLAAAVIPANAAAAHKQLWVSDTLNAVANDVAGTTDMSVLSEDNAGEWATFFPPGTASENVGGFVILGYPPLYHRIFLAPVVYSTFSSWFSTGTAQGNEYAFSEAAMTLIHESFHWRLLSADESTVNACALKYFPDYLAKDFNVPELVTQTTMQEVPVTTTTRVPVTHVKATKHRVRVNGVWVTRTRRTTVTTYKTQTVTSYESHPVTATVANPLFQTLVADASNFYSRQPPPYNSGVCSV
jgi:hypothetical protein